MTNKVKGMLKREHLESFTLTKQHIYEHYSGFKISFVPKPGFNRKFVSIALPVGANDLSFYTDDKGVVTLPAGTAHYMEHCVFKQNANYSFDAEMAKYGINANAYTTNDHTLYFFSCVENLEAGLEIFLDALLHPDIGEERVEKERPIIRSELEMYRDDVASFCYERLLDNLYINHPVRFDIVGTPKSLQEISAKHLALLHQYFYHPAAMHISVVGDVDELHVIEKVFSLIGEHLENAPQKRALTVKVSEPDYVKRPLSLEKMQIGNPYFCLGLKDPVINARNTLTGRDLVSYEIGLSLLFNLLIGESSPIYNELFQEGLIDESFFNEFRVSRDYAYWVCGGYAKRPREVVQRIYTALCQSIKERQLKQSEFDLKVKAETGDFLMSLDRISASGYKMAELLLKELDLFDELAIYRTLTLDELWPLAEFALNENLQACSIIEPLEVE